MTYRERRQARADRLRGWADKREDSADARYQAAASIADNIPFGQPILVGHHSEGRARRDMARIDNNMRASIESSRMAHSMHERANNIEAAAANAIYSDDPDAVEQLRAKLTRLEAERDSIKTFNVQCRKGIVDTSLLVEGQRKDYESCRQFSGSSIGKRGEMPAYVLSNLGGNIARLRKRVVSLERRAAL